MGNHRVREDEDWDEISPIHKAHRTVTDVPLTSGMVKFYLFIIVLTIIVNTFFNF